MTHYTAKQGDRGREREAGKGGESIYDHPAVMQFIILQKIDHFVAFGMYR